MPEPGQESGTTEKSVGWEQALTETLSKSLEAEKTPETKAASEPDPSSEPSTPAKVEEPAETEASEVQESKTDALEPPEKWSEETKTYFKSLDPVGQKFLLEREKDV